MASEGESAALKVIDEALSLTGKESRRIILSYIQDRYGMDLNSLLRYKEEFTNYLEEVLGDSADIITARINQALDDFAARSKPNLSKPVCYICNRTFSQEGMAQHLMRDHTREEVAHYLAAIYVDDWREEAELRFESNSNLHHLLRN